MVSYIIVDEWVVGILDTFLHGVAGARKLPPEKERI
jgi:hypothetical protein